VPGASINPARALHDRLLVLLFLGALAAPWADLLVRPDERRSPLNREHRQPSPRPALPRDARALHKFPAAFESWFEDSFGLRDILLRWHSRQSLGLLGVSPTPAVLLGKQGWYFFTGDRSVEAWRGRLPFGEPQLELWRKGLEARRDLLRAEGIDYLFVIAPNKETIYPDFMPDGLERVGPTRLEQFVAHLSSRSDLPFLDLRDALREARAQDTPQSHLYFEEGTHWNARGCLVAYQAILGRLAERHPELEPLPAREWRLVEFDGPGDSWASNMYIGDLSERRGSEYVRQPQRRRARQLNPGLEGRFGAGRRLLLGTEDPQLPRVLLLSDSFGPFVEWLLAENCSRLYSRWTYDFDPVEVLEFAPRVVVELWVERALVFRDPKVLGPKPGLKPEEEFARAREVCLELDPVRSPAPKAVGSFEVVATQDERGPAFRLRAGSVADQVELPEFSREPRGRPLLRIEIDSPVEGVLDVFYLLQGEAEYTRLHNCPVRLARGRNDVCVRMPEAGVTGRLRLRPRARRTVPAAALRGPVERRPALSYGSASRRWTCGTTRTPRSRSRAISATLSTSSRAGAGTPLTGVAGVRNSASEGAHSSTSSSRPANSCASCPPLTTILAQASRPATRRRQASRARFHSSRVRGLRSRPAAESSSGGSRSKSGFRSRLTWSQAASTRASVRGCAPAVSRCSRRPPSSGFSARTKSGQASGSPPVTLTLRGEPGSHSAIQHAAWNGVAHAGSRLRAPGRAIRADPCAGTAHEPGVSHQRQRSGQPKSRRKTCGSPTNAPSPWMEAKTSSTGACTDGARSRSDIGGSPAGYFFAGLAAAAGAAFAPAAGAAAAGAAAPGAPGAAAFSALGFLAPATLKRVRTFGMP